MRVRYGWLGRCTLLLGLVVYQILDGGQEVQYLRSLGVLRVYGGVVTVMGLICVVLYSMSGSSVVFSVGEWIFVIVMGLFGLQSFLVGIVLGNPLSYIISDAARPIMTAVLFTLTLILCRRTKGEYREIGRKCAMWLLAVDMFRLGLYGFDFVIRRTFIRHQSGKLMAPWWLATALVESPSIGAMLFLVLEVVLHVVSGQRTSTLGLFLMIALIVGFGPRRTRVWAVPIMICCICLMLTTSLGQNFFVPRMEAVLSAVRARDMDTLDYLSGRRMTEISGGLQTIRDNLPMSLLAGAGAGAEIRMELTGTQKHQIHNTYMAMCVRFGVIPTLILIVVLFWLIGSCSCSYLDRRFCLTMRIYIIVLLMTYNLFYGLIGEAEFAVALGLFRAMCRRGDEERSVPRWRRFD